MPQNVSYWAEATERDTTIERLTREHQNEVNHCNQLAGENDRLRAEAEALYEQQARREHALCTLQEDYFKLREALEQIASFSTEIDPPQAHGLSKIAREALAGLSSVTAQPQKGD